MMRQVLVVAAHPDDEILGCGGTIAALAQRGTHIQVAYLADGVSARGKLNQARRARRREAAYLACETVGATPPHFGDLPDNRLDSLPRLQVNQAVEALIADHAPDTIFTHHAGDLNVDHRRVHEAVVTACRPQRGHSVRTLLFFEVPSSTEWQTPYSAPPFLPNWFIDISNNLDQKLTALDAYAEEMRPWPHPRSREGVEHLARWRGATIGVEAAEAFVLGRHLA